MTCYPVHIITFEDQMKIIVNKSIPKEARINISKIGIEVAIETDGITYSAISGHPDIFFCKVDNVLIAAPNIPNEVVLKLSKLNIEYIYGVEKVGKKYPNSAKYNAVVTDNYLIHNLKVTDNKIKELCVDKTPIHVNQAYTRCNLLPLNDGRFVTSDMGIYNTLSNNNIEVLFVDPKHIILPGFDNGFFGGACGIYNDRIYIIGSLLNFEPGIRLSKYLSIGKLNIVELYNGPLYDGGSLLFID